MKILTLTRDEMTRLHTIGTLEYGNLNFYTIERPWIPTDPGGKPMESCVPEGEYDLRPHTRPNGDQVVALVNPGLGVYYQAEDRPNGVGRYLILIHAGNRVSDVVGCIAPGISRGPNWVTDSRKAMKFLMEFLGDEPAKLIITRGKAHVGFG